MAWPCHETNPRQDLYLPVSLRRFYSSGYFIHYCKFHHSHKHAICANSQKNLQSLTLALLKIKTYKIHRAENWLSVCKVPWISLLIAVTVAQLMYWNCMKEDEMEIFANKWRRVSGLICDCQGLIDPTNKIWWQPGTQLKLKPDSFWL